MKQAFEKFLAYHALETVDTKHIKHVEDVRRIWHEHNNELNEMWNQTNYEAWQNLVLAFREELKREWLREFVELSSVKVTGAMRESLITYIEMAYQVGYMWGKLWISQEHGADFNLCLGDKLASDIRSSLKGAKSRGIAFASAFAAVAVQGYLVASGQ